MHRDRKKQPRAWKPEDFMRRRPGQQDRHQQSYEDMKSILWMTKQYMHAKAETGPVAVPPAKRLRRR